MKMRELVWAPALALWAMAGVAAADVVKAEGAKVVLFDQAGDADGLAKIITVPKGSQLQIQLSNTCKDEFTLGVLEHKTVKVPKAAPLVGMLVAPPCAGTEDLLSTAVTVTEPTQYEIKVEGGPTTSAAGPRTPKVYYLTVLTESSPWNLQFGGGFAFSSLTNHKYTLAPGTGTGNYVVARNKGSEDDVAVGLAGFLHVAYGPCEGKYGCVAGSLGIGTDSSAGISLYPGVTWLFKEYALTFGVEVAETKALPGSLKEGDTTTDANALNTLDKKLDTGFFIALSYKFLGGNVESQVTPKFAKAN